MINRVGILGGQAYTNIDAFAPIRYVLQCQKNMVMLCHGGKVVGYETSGPQIARANLQVLRIKFERRRFDCDLDEAMLLTVNDKFETCCFSQNQCYSKTVWYEGGLTNIVQMHTQRTGGVMRKHNCPIVHQPSRISKNKSMNGVKLTCRRDVARCHE